VIFSVMPFNGRNLTPHTLSVAGTASLLHAKNRLAGFEPLVQEMANSRQPAHKLGRFKGILKVSMLALELRSPAA